MSEYEIAKEIYIRAIATSEGIPSLTEEERRKILTKASEFCIESARVFVDTYREIVD